MNQPIIELKIEDTYRLKSDKLAKIIDKINRTDKSEIKLTEDCLELYSNIRFDNGMLNTVNGVTARIINGKNIDKNPHLIYLQTFNVPYGCVPLRKNESILYREPNYVDLLKEFIDYSK
jgi:hypothetical protein